MDCGSKMPRIIYDSREAKSLVINNLMEKCHLEEKVLETGDFILSDRVVCERKTADDFIASIADGRLFSQLSCMKNAFSSPVMIIEGNEIYHTNMKPQAVRGALASIAIDFSVPVLWTKSPSDTAEMLLSMAMREQFIDGRDVKIRNGRKPKDTKKMQKFLISGLPGIDSYRAENLLKHFKCPEFIFTASEKELRKVDGVGKETARRIRDIMGKDYE